MSTFRSSNQTPDGKTLCVYDVSTPDIVVAALERCIIKHLTGENIRVRFFYGDTDRPDFEKVHNRLPDPGKDWNEENDMSGYIGKSTGLQPIPLLLANSKSRGGGSILDGCIVRMLIQNPLGGFYEAYRHPNYHNAMERSSIIVPSDMPEYEAMITIDGDVPARFKKYTSAVRYVSFMIGKRMTK